MPTTAEVVSGARALNVNSILEYKRYTIPRGVWAAPFFSGGHLRHRRNQGQVDPRHLRKKYWNRSLCNKKVVLIEMTTIIWNRI